MKLRRRQLLACVAASIVLSIIRAAVAQTVKTSTKTILVDAIGTFFIAGVGVYKPMYELLEKYPNRKIVLTGANDQQIEKTGLKNIPYQLFTLKHNPEKSDPKYFTIMLEQLALTAKEVVYFEHDPSAVASARSVGITSYYYDPKLRDLAGLKKFLDENL